MCYRSLTGPYILLSILLYLICITDRYAPTNFHLTINNLENSKLKVKTKKTKKKLSSIKSESQYSHTARVCSTLYQTFLYQTKTKQINNGFTYVPYDAFSTFREKTMSNKEILFTYKPSEVHTICLENTG